MLSKWMRRLAVAVIGPRRYDFTMASHELKQPPDPLEVTITDLVNNSGQTVGDKVQRMKLVNNAFQSLRSAVVDVEQTMNKIRPEPQHRRPHGTVRRVLLNLSAIHGETPDRADAILNNAKSMMDELVSIMGHVPPPVIGQPDPVVWYDRRGRPFSHPEK